MHEKLSKILIVICVVFAAASCHKPTAYPTESPPDSSSNRLLVVCEGSLGNGNSALTVYDNDEHQAFEDVYASVNGQPLGDVFQSITRIEDQLFLCINNSDKIIIVNADDYKLEGTISIPKPRYILPISATKAYVTTLFRKEVYVINAQTQQRTDTTILPSSNGEGMVLRDDKAYICAWDTAANHVYVVNTATDEIVDTLLTPGRAPQSAGFDADGMLWVLSGNVVKGKIATLARFNTATGNYIQSYTFPATADPMRLEWNAAKDTLYFIGVNYNGGTAHNGIYRMSIHASDLPAQPFIPAASLQYFWAVGIEPGTGHIFVGDPKGFTQKGQVYVYNTDGTLLRSFNTGVGPGHFFFDY